MALFVALARAVEPVTDYVLYYGDTPSGYYYAINVSTEAELDYALLDAAYQGPGLGLFQINLTNSITLTQNLPQLALANGNWVQIWQPNVFNGYSSGYGQYFTINGAGQYNGFINVSGGDGQPPLTINGIDFENFPTYSYTISDQTQLAAAIAAINADDNAAVVGGIYQGTWAHYTLNFTPGTVIQLDAGLAKLTAGQAIQVTVNGNGAMLISDNAGFSNFSTNGNVTVNDLYLINNGADQVLATPYDSGGPYIEYYHVNNEADLINDINLVNDIAQYGEGGLVAVDLLISPGATITLTQDLPQIVTNLGVDLVIDGNGATIDGKGKFSGLNDIVGYTNANAPAVFLENLTFANIGPETFSVSNEAQLAAAVNTINAADSANVLGGNYTGTAANYEIDLTAGSTIDLTAARVLSPAHGVAVTVNGNGALVDGGSQYWAFTTSGQSNASVTISDVRLAGLANAALKGDTAYGGTFNVASAAQFQNAIFSINASAGTNVDYYLNDTSGAGITLPSGGIPQLYPLGDLVTTNFVNALTLDVANATDLSNAIELIDGFAATNSADAPNYVINFTPNAFIDLNADLPMLTVGNNNHLTINGNGATIYGEDTYRGLLVYSGGATVNNLTFQDTEARGGDGGWSAGGGGGGGGAGLGGGLFVGSGANVTIDNVNFVNTSAVGGAGGSPNLLSGYPFGNGGGGGGGMGGSGSASEYAGSLDGSDVGNGGGGGGGGLGYGADGGYINLAPGNGIATGSGAAGSGGGLSYTNKYVVTSYTDYRDGGAAGASGGGGGWGYGTGGGGGGIAGEAVGGYSLGSAGFEFSADPFAIAWTIVVALGEIALTVATDGEAAGEAESTGAELESAGLAADAAIEAAGAGASETASASVYDTLSTTAQSVLKEIGTNLFESATGIPLSAIDALQTLTQSVYTALGGPDPILVLDTNNFSNYQAPDGNKNFVAYKGLGVDWVNVGGGAIVPGGGSGGFGGGGGGGGAESLGGSGGYGGGGGGGGQGLSAVYGGDGSLVYGQSLLPGGYGGFGGGAGAAGFQTFTYPTANPAYTLPLSDAGLSGYWATDLNGTAGFGAGAAGQGTGGGGLGAGGGVFVQNGGQITIGGTSSVEGSVTGGAGGGSGAGAGGSGSAYGGGVFLQGNETLNLNPALGQVESVGDIADQAGSVLEYASSPLFLYAYAGKVAIDGAGTVQMGGLDTYLGGTYLDSGTLELLSDATLNPYGIFYLQGGSLVIDAGMTLGATLDVSGISNPTIELLGSFDGAIHDLAAAGSLSFIGGGEANILQAGGSNTDYVDAWQEVNAAGQTLTSVTDVQLGGTLLVASSAAEAQSLLTWIAGTDGPAISGAATFDISLDGGLNEAFTSGPLVIPTLAAGQAILLDDTGSYFSGLAEAAGPLVLGGTLTLNGATPTILRAAAGQTLDVTAVLTQSGGGGLLGIQGNRVILPGSNALTGTVTLGNALLELTSAAAVGASTIDFSDAASTLLVDGGVAPAGAIAGFVLGDTIDFTGIAPPALPWQALGAGGTLALSGGQSLSFTGLAAGARFSLVSDGAGGTAISLNEYASRVTTAAQLNAALSASLPRGADASITLAAAGGVLSDTALPVGVIAQDERLSLVGGGGTLAGGGGAGLVIGGDTTLSALSLLGFDGPALTVQTGGTAMLQGVTLGGSVSLAVGATLEMTSGRIGGEVGAGPVLLLPAAGATVSLAGTFASSIVIGDTAGLAGTLATPAGGLVLTGPGASLAGTTTVLTQDTLDLGLGASFGTIALASPVGATLRIEGTALPGGVISLAAGNGTIDLANVVATGATVLTVGAGGTLAVPGATGGLHFGAGVAAGTPFLMTSDGDNGALLRPLAQTATITTEAEYAALVPMLNALPGGDGLRFTLDIPAGLSLGVSPPLLSPAAAVLEQGGGGITLGAGVSLAQGSGVGLAGAGTIDFAGANATLRTTGATNAFIGLQPTDTLDLTGVATSAGTLQADFAGQVTLPTAGGNVVVSLPDLQPLSQVIAAPDGQGGTVLTTKLAHQYIPVATEAQLDAALRSAETTNANTEIVLAPGARFSLTQALPEIAPLAGAAVFIQGNGDTIDGAGQWGGLFAASGVLTVQNLTLADMTTKGATGAGGSWGGGGGGAGLGGGLYVGGSASVTLMGVSFLNDAAQGGTGGLLVPGAGLGLGGAGDANTGGAGLAGTGSSGTGSVEIDGSPYYYQIVPAQFGGGTGGYDASLPAGAGGMAAGGGIYVDFGGSLTLLGAASETGGAVSGGASGDGGTDPNTQTWQEPFGGSADIPGQAYGAGLFYAGSGAISFSPVAGSLQRIADPIADELGVVTAQTPSGALSPAYIVGTDATTGAVSLDMTGAGTLELDGANQYAGTTDVEAGTLLLTGGLSGLLGPVLDNATVVLGETADTSFANPLTGSGRLIRNGAGTVTLTGGLAVSGGLTLTAGALALAGAGLADAAPISGSGTLVADSSGVISLSGSNNSFSGELLLAGGTLALLTQGVAGTGTIGFGAGANALLSVASGVTLGNVITGFLAGDSIDLQGIGTPLSLPVRSGNTLLVATTAGTTALTLDPVLANDGTLFTAVSDGAGGAMVAAVSSTISVANEAQLNNAIAAISLGGAQYGNGARDQITFIGSFYANDYYGTGIAVDAPLQTIDLAPGVTLDLLAPADFNFYNAPTSEAAAQYVPIGPIDVRDGTVRMISPGDLSAVTFSYDGFHYGNTGGSQISGGLDVAAGATATLDIGGTVWLGASTIDGTLDLLNGSGFPGGLFGGGQLIIDPSGGTISLGGGSFAGTITVRSGMVSGLPDSSGALVLDGGTAEISGAGGGRIVFAGAASLVIDDANVNPYFTPQLGGGSVIYGFAQGDGIVSNGLSLYVNNPFTSVTLEAGNVLRATTPYGGVTLYQLDPQQRFAGQVFGISSGTIALAPTTYSVATARQLEAALASIEGVASAVNTAYTITLTGDLTGANAVGIASSQISLQSGSSLSIVGQGHTIDAGGATLFYDSGADTLRLSNLTLLNGAANPSEYAGVVIANAATLSGVSILGGGFGSLPNFTPAGPTEGTIVETTTLGQTATLDGPFGVGTLDVAGAGTVVWALPYAGTDASPSRTVLQSGTLELAAASTQGWSYYGAGFSGLWVAGGTLRIDQAAPLPLFLQQMDGTLDFAAVAPSALQVQYSTQAGDTSFNGVVIPYVTPNQMAVTSDGAGGTLVYRATTSFSAVDEAGLNAAVAAIAPGGAQAVPAGAAETITLAPPTGTLALGAAAQAISLGAGSTLLLNGGGAVLDGGGAQGGLAVTGGVVTLEHAGFAHMAPGAAALAIAAGATVTLLADTFATGSTISLAAGGQLNLSSGTLAASLTGTGSVAATGSVTLAAPGDFGGTIAVGGTLDLAGGNATGSGTIALASGSRLELAAGVQVADAITGLVNGGTIRLDGITGASDNLAGGLLSVAGTGGAVQLSLADAGLSAQNLLLVQSGTTATDITYSTRATAGVSIATTTALGQVPFGLVQDTITVTNLAGAGGETISGGFGPLGTGLSGDGSLTLAPGQSGTLTLDIKPAATGAFSGLATLDITSNAPGRVAVPLALSALDITGTAYAGASPIVQSTLDLGAGRLGGAALSGQFSITDGTQANAYQRALSYGASASGLVIAGSQGTVSAGGSVAIGVSLSATAAGVYSGAVRVGLTAAPVGALAAAALGSATVPVGATLYSTATAQLTGSIDFGIVHVGDSIAQALTLANAAAPSPYADVLSGTLAGLSSGFTAAGTLSSITAGSAGSLTLGLVTTQSGTLRGAATLSLTSHDAALADVTSSGTVALAGTVDNYATASLGLAAGAGTLSGSGNRYTLDLGTLTRSETATLAVRNSAGGLADLLAGGFGISGAANFTDIGFTSFSGLAAGQSHGGLVVSLAPGSVGTLSETITLAGTGSNAGGYVGTLAPVALTVVGTVSPVGFVATSEAALDGYIAAISQGGSLYGTAAEFAVTLAPAGGTLALTASLASLDAGSGVKLTVIGAGSTIDGGGTAGGFVAKSGTLSLQSLSLDHLSTALAVAADGSVNLGAVTTDSQISLAAGGNLTLGTFTTTSGINVAAGGTLALSSATLATGAPGGGTITLASGGILTLTGTGALGNTIEGFVGGTLDAASIAGGTASLNGGTLVIANATQALTIDLAESNFSAYGLSIGSDGAGGTTVTEIAALQHETTGVPVISPGTVAFADVHVGDTATAGLTIANTLAAGGDALAGGFAANAGVFTGSGSVDVAPGASGTLSLAEATGTAGSFSATLPLALANISPLGTQRPVAGQSITATGAVFALAAPSVGTVDLGPTRVGGTLAGTISITNANAAAAGFQEALDYEIGTPNTGLTVSGGESVAAGGTAAVAVTLDTSQAGTFLLGAPVTLVSDGTGIDTLGTTQLAGQALLVSGTVYAAATAAVTPSVDLGWIHVGGSVSRAVTIDNLAVGSLADSLVASAASLSAGLAAPGTLTLAASTSGTLGLTLSTAQAGLYAGNAALGLVSEDPAQANLVLANATVAVTGTVLNYATLSLGEAFGGGTLVGGGIQTLDLGLVSAPQTVGLAVTNSATGLADNLAGAITAGSGGIDISSPGTVGFTGLAPGQTGSALSIEVAPVLGGVFSETVVASGTGSNGFGYSGAVSGATLVVTGTAAYGPYTFAQPVSTLAELNADLAAIANGGSLADIDTAYTIALAGGTLALSGALAQVSMLAGSSLTILGNGATIDGEGAQQGFVLAGGTLNLQNLTIANALAQGAAGGTAVYYGGGGGAAGLGGGLFVASGATANLAGVAFSGDAAIGGAGGGIPATAAEESNQGNPGASQLPGGFAAGAAGGPSHLPVVGGSAGFGGGGGGGGLNSFGIGLGAGGSGGFGGGAGLAAGLYPGVSVYQYDTTSGSNLLSVAYAGAGGGGLGAGADVFVQAGGSLSVQNGTLAAGTVAGGAGGTVDPNRGFYGGFNNISVPTAASGQGLGSTVFLQSGGAISFTPAVGQTVQLATGVASDGTLSALTLNGPGTLSVPAGSFAGSVDILQGVLALSLGGTAPGAIANAGTLNLSNSGTTSFAGALSGAGGITITQGGTDALLLAGTLGLTGSTDLTAGTLDLASGPAGFGGAVTLGTGAVLAVAGTGTLASVVDGLVGGTIDATGVAGGTAALSGGTLVIGNGTSALTIDLAESNYSALGLRVSADGAGGTAVSEVPGLQFEVAAAAALSPGSIALGALHVGATASAAISVSNTAAAGADALGGGFGAAQAPFGGAGSLNVAPGATGTLSITASPTSAGSFAASLPLALSSITPLGGHTPLTSPSVSVSAVAYALASPSVSTLDLGSTRLGAGSLSGAFVVSNPANASTGYQESLDYAVGTPVSGLQVAGSGALAAGATASVSATLTPSAAGSLTLTAPITLTSDGTGIDTLGTTVLAAQTLVTTATVYAAAVASVSPTMDLGWEHVSPYDGFIGYITVENTATGALTDTLAPSLAGALPKLGVFQPSSDTLFVTGPYGVPATALGSGQTGTLGVEYLPAGTVSVGVLSGMATIDLVSQDPGLPNLVLTPATVAVVGTIGNYATLALSQTSGGGRWSGSGGLYMLDLGQVSANQTIDLAIANTATGPADTLAGSISASASSPDIVALGTADFAGLGPGQADTALSLVATPGTAGVFTETVVVTGTGSDPGGYSGAVGAQTLTVTGTVTAKATLGLSEISGGGTLSGAGSQYTLDLGTLRSAGTFDLSIANTGTDATHALMGSITASGGGLDLTTLGTAAFTGLAPGQTDTALSLVATSGTLGALSETIVIAGTDVGPGVTTALAPVTLTVTGTMASGSYSFAQPVSTIAQLNADITAINSGGSLAAAGVAYTLDLAGGTLALTSALSQLSLLAGSSLTIIGNGTTIDGGGAEQGFVLAAGTLDLQNLAIVNATAQGAAGQDGEEDGTGGGGGAAGLGGGLFVAPGAEAIGSGVTFANDSAIGGGGGNITYYGVVYPAGGVSNLPDGYGTGAAGSRLTLGTAGFGGGGGGGADPLSTPLLDPMGSPGGYGGGNGQSRVVDYYYYPGAGGGGFGAGADAFVAAGGTLLLQNSVLGAGTVQGGAAGTIDPDYTYGHPPANPATSGQALGSLVFVESGGTVSLTAAASGTIGLDSPGPGTLIISGGNTVTLGGTLVSTGSIMAGSFGSGPIVDNANLVVLGTQTGRLVSTGVRPGFAPGEQLVLNVNNYTNYTTTTNTLTLGGTGGLADLAAAISSLEPQTFLQASVAGNTLTLTDAATGNLYFTLSTVSGLPISGVVTGGDGQNYNGQVSGYLMPASAAGTPGFNALDLTATVALAATGLLPTDAIAVNGTVVTVGRGGSFSDWVAAINGAGIAGVSASLDAGQHLAIASSLAPLSLQDVSGTPLEALGLASGTLNGARSYDGPISGSGNLRIDQFANETMTLSGPLALAGTLNLTAGTLELTGSLAGFTGTIENNGTVVLTGTAAETFGGTVTGPGVLEAACYVPGTRILTDHGEIPIEDLRETDRVMTVFGDYRPIVWIGKRTYAGRFIRGNKRVLPITFKAGSLADGVPARDLTVSPLHAMFLDGVLIDAQHLVNGESVIQAESVDEITYYNIELDTHDVILAEGAASETFVGDESRKLFQNATEYTHSYSGAARQETIYYAPRVDHGAAVFRARNTIARRVGLPEARVATANGPLRGFLDRVSGDTVEGWAQAIAAPEDPVELEILLDGSVIGTTLANRPRADLAAALRGSGCHAFVFHAPRGLCLDQERVSLRRASDHVILPLNRPIVARAA